ncbi:hypothetical protein G7Y89_g12534 [Cudoniella acicularis]|uniref:CFEM domain-containing protein n=1 Tax=Cudoniella acicularis TaxID=354080 RepID=A0A8H4R9W9_9HELO|nr:hypothetical protein G7Y89_g12534 [Cudoniella acicularis]
MRPQRATSPLILLLLSHLINQGSSQNTVSLFTWPEYEVLRECAQKCIWGYTGSVADTIGCPGGPWYDACICNPNEMPSAASHVSICVQSSCTSGSNVDAPTAVAAYTDYCFSAGYTTAGQASPTMSLDLKTVSLFSDSGFEMLQSCAQDCVWGQMGSVADTIGCAEPWYNMCVCNVAQQPKAMGSVGSCITTRCTGTVDVSTAMEVYTNYCSKAGYSVNAATIVTATGGGGSAGPTLTITTPATTAQPTTKVVTTGGNSLTTVVSTPSTTPTSTGSSSGSSSLLSSGGIIGVAISATCSILGLLFGIGWKIYKHKKQEKLSRPVSVYQQERNL